MAKLPQLLHVLSQVDGRSFGTMEQASRLLRENDLLAVGKRGGGAPDMDFVDAANLLIGVNSSDSLVRSPIATELMRQLRPSGGATEQVYPLSDIAQAPNFGEALAWTIMTAPWLGDLADSMIDHRYGAPDYSHDDREAFCRQSRLGMGPLHFRAQFGRTFARLALEWSDANPVAAWERRFYAGVDLLRRAPAYLHGDRRVTVEVGFPTIIALHDCIAGKSVANGAPQEPRE